MRIYHLTGKHYFLLDINKSSLKNKTLINKTNISHIFLILDIFENNIFLYIEFKIVDNKFRSKCNLDRIWNLLAKMIYKENKNTSNN